MRRAIGLLGVLFVAYTLTAQEAHFKKGLELLRQERYADALSEFAASRRSESPSAVMENAAGIAATKLGRMDEAERFYTAAIRLNPKYASAQRNLAVNQMEQKQYADAETHLKSAAAIEPSDPFAHYYLAILYLNTGRDRDAADQITPAGELLSGDADAAFRMARACLRLNQTTAALSLVEALERHSAVSSMQEQELAGMFYAAGRFPEAVDRLRRVVASNPESWVSRYNLAIGLLAAKQLPEAIALFETVSHARPEDAKILARLGAAYEAGDRLPQALEAYRRAAQADPGDPDRYLDYSRVLMDLDRYDESEEYVRANLDKVPDTYALHVRLGSVQMMSGRYTEARASFQKAIDEHPEIAVGYAGLAQGWLKDGQAEEAVKALTLGRTKVPPDFAIEYYSGLALVRLERSDEAVAAFTRAVQLSPMVPEGRYELGKLYFATGKIAEARAEFEAVVKLAPKHSNAHYQLSRVYARLGDETKAREMAAKTRELKQEQREAGLASQRARLGRFETAPNEGGDRIK